MNFLNLRLLILISLLLGVLSGCTRHIYGVPHDEWRYMSEQQRAEARSLYQERRLYEEKRRAAEAEIRAREMATHRHYYPETIYLHLSGGAFIIRGKRYAFHQQAFQLRRGETRTLILVSTDGRHPHKIKVWVRYLDGKVMLGDGKRDLHTLGYSDAWNKGERYRGIKLGGGVHLDDVDLFIGSRPIEHRPSQHIKSDGQHGRGTPSDGLPPVNHREEESQGGAANENGRGLRKYEVERLKQERAKQERAKQERAKQERAKQERAKQERAKQEQAKQEQAKQEQAKQEQAKQEQAKQEQAKQERTKQERAKQERTKQEQTKLLKEKQGKEEKEKKESNGNKAECIEHGKSNGRSKNGLPYCDE